MNNKFESSGAIYDKNEKNWQKSTAEIAAFILGGLNSRPHFFEFICGQEVEENVAGRWQQRLNDLLDKAQKRAGHQIDKEALLADARQHLINQISSGELGESGVYRKFLELKVDDFKLKV